jgi:hypothetical protein
MQVAGGLVRLASQSIGVIIGAIIPVWICIDIGSRVRIDVRPGSIVSIRIGLNIAPVESTEYPQA